MHWNIIKKFMRRQIGFLNYNLNKDLQNITKITLLNFYSQQLDKEVSFKLLCAFWFLL